MIKKTTLACGAISGIISFLALWARYESLGSNIADLGFIVSMLSKVQLDISFILFSHLMPALLFPALLQSMTGVDGNLVLIGLQSVLVGISTAAVYHFWGRFGLILLLANHFFWVACFSDFHIENVVIVSHLLIYSSILRLIQPLWFWFGILLLASCKEVYLVQAILFFVVGYLVRFDFGIVGKLSRFFVTGAFCVVLLSIFIWFSESARGAFSDGLLPSLLADTGLGFFDSEFIEPRDFTILVATCLATSAMFYRADLRLLIPVLPIFFGMVLSNNPHQWSYVSHYTLGFFIPLFVATVEGLGLRQSAVSGSGLISGERWLKPFALTLSLIFLVVMSVSPVSRLFWSDKIFHWSYLNYYPFESKTEAVKEHIRTFIPQDPSVTVSVQNNINYGPISNRNNVVLFPAGSSFPTEFWIHTGTNMVIERKFADYVIIDTSGSVFFIDQGCEYVNQKCHDSEVLANFTKSVSAALKSRPLIASRDGFMILGPIRR